MLHINLLERLKHLCRRLLAVGKCPQPLGKTRLTAQSSHSSTIPRSPWRGLICKSQVIE